MCSYRLLFASLAALTLAPAVPAEPTAAAKRAIPATTPLKSTAAAATPVKRALPAQSVKATPAEPGITFNSVQIDEPYIAMTFDDGPSAILTPKLLDLLAARHIKATFFVVGQNVAEHPEIVARAAREGHEIANHSWSHPNLGKMSDENVRRQLQQTDDAIKNATGKRPKIGRASCRERV